MGTRRYLQQRGKLCIYTFFLFSPATRVVLSSQPQKLSDISVMCVEFVIVDTISDAPYKVMYRLGFFPEVWIGKERLLSLYNYRPQHVVVKGSLF